MTSVMNWLNFNRAVYFGNATSMRDFRVQLRGNRSVLLFGTYLVVLIGVAMFVYSDAVGAGQLSVVEAQTRLQSFYTIVMGLLAGTICLVAPALSASTVVLEKQRGSLDLIFSAPVTPKYYLVGKMLSSYRYIWMLLALSLPVTAACVMLGGASWGDVLGAYMLLSIQAMVLTALSLLMSTLAPRPVSAVLWSYAVCIPYLLLTAGGVSLYAYSAFQQRTMEAPFAIALNPFTATEAVGTFSVLGGLHVPNWIPALVITLLITKISLLCAGSLLNPSGKEARNLRIHGLVYMSAFMGFLGYVSKYAFGPYADAGSNIGREFAWSFMPLFAVVPFMACYALDAENRFKPNGMFKLRGLFRPTPATALPYLLTLLGASACALLVGFSLGPNNTLGVVSISASVGSDQFAAVNASGPNLSTLAMIPTFLPYFALTAGLWTFFWAIGRFISSLSIGLRSARGLTFAVFLLVCAMPVPVLAAIDPLSVDKGANLWSLWVLKSLVSTYHEANTEAMTYSVILVLLAIPISIYAETRLKEMLAARQAKTAKAA
jgi:hypothetical protein